MEYVERAMPGLDPDPIAWVQLLGDPLPWGSDAVARYSDGTNFFIAGNNLFKHCASARGASGRGRGRGQLPGQT
ncbi:MAG: hypothetical protein M3N47_04935 [Chloroflexota bacterium]|nr:hypothetical protein [Chloroflexota bacterium]